MIDVKIDRTDRADRHEHVRARSATSIARGEGIVVHTSVEHLDVVHAATDAPADRTRMHSPQRTRPPVQPIPDNDTPRAFTCVGAQA